MTRRGSERLFRAAFRPARAVAVRRVPAGRYRCQWYRPGEEGATDGGAVQHGGGDELSLDLPYSPAVLLLTPD